MGLQWGAQIRHDGGMVQATGLLALGLALMSAEAAGSETLTLRVLTYNVWGVPMIAPLRPERMTRIGPAIAALSPDLVALQEVWTDEDAEILTEGLAQIGLTHIERFTEDWPDDSGLMIASRYPIEKVRFSRYRQGRHPHLPWHVDYMAGKGIARVTVRTPLGEVDFAATHLQAGYGTNEYVFVQMSQALQAAKHVAKGDAPLILAGDINSPHDGIPSRLLAARARLHPTDPKAGIDQILYRSGRQLRIAPGRVQTALTEPVDLESAVMPLSDHPAVLAELHLSRCAGECVVPGLGAHLGRLSTEVLPIVKQEVELRRFRMTRDLVLALCFPFVGFILAIIGRRLGGRASFVVRGAAVILILAAAWFTYLNTSFGPAHLHGLLEIEGQLVSAPMDEDRPAAAVFSRSGS